MCIVKLGFTSLVQARDLYGNSLILTAPAVVGVSIMGSQFLSLCSAMEVLNCIQMETIGSELQISFIPTLSTLHRINVSKKPLIFEHAI